MYNNKYALLNIVILGKIKLLKINYLMQRANTKHRFTKTFPLPKVNWRLQACIYCVALQCDLHPPV